MVKCYSVSSMQDPTFFLFLTLFKKIFWYFCFLYLLYQGIGRPSPCAYFVNEFCYQRYMIIWFYLFSNILTHILLFFILLQFYSLYFFRKKYFFLFFFFFIVWNFDIVFSINIQFYFQNLYKFICILVMIKKNLYKYINILISFTLFSSLFLYKLFFKTFTVNTNIF